MASSKVMSSTSPSNPDLPRHSTTSNNTLTPTHTPPLASVKRPPLLSQQPPPQAHHLHHADHSVSSFGSMNMEEILKNIYSEPDSLSTAVDGGDLPALSAVDGGGVGGNAGGSGMGSKTVDEVWKEIVSGGGGGGGGRTDEPPRMTLEDFLTKAGAVSEEDVRVPVPQQVPAGGVGGYGVEAMMNSAVPAAGVQFPAAPVPVIPMQNGQGGYGMESQLGFGNGMVVAAPAAAVESTRGGGGSGRGKRRAPPVTEVALDKATQQKQRRMIKNRESAARSRERKQAYTVELESLVTKLEEEKTRLLREEAEQNKERLKQLMENLIPVVEKQRPPRVLRRVQSMSW
ncbi:hypothetical protein ACH5RR_001954 [Cinchona calisaya]|uniref:BZIP domain-containing protein n=1 Tax=Cinchona calisaya TaxID=153742 RepID=A0ABD3B5J0_9GENT